MRVHPKREEYKTWMVASTDSDTVDGPVYYGGPYLSDGDAKRNMEVNKNRTSQKFKKKKT